MFVAYIYRSGERSKGSVSFAQSICQLATPVDNVIYFAGEACYNSTYNGSFAAAYNSALRAGLAIAGCLEQEKRGGPGGGEDACAWRPMTGMRP